MLLRPDLPATRTPPRIGIGVPASERPMRRLKNKSVCTGVDRERAAGAHGEEVRVLEEEVALLRIEQAEPRQVDLLLVDLDLREVGVDGDVHVEAGRQAVARIEADVADGVGGRATVRWPARRGRRRPVNGFKRRSRPREISDSPCSSPAMLTRVSV